MFIDDKLTTDMQGWLNTEPAKRRFQNRIRTE